MDLLGARTWFTHLLLVLTLLFQHLTKYILVASFKRVCSPLRKRLEFPGSEELRIPHLPRRLLRREAHFTLSSALQGWGAVSAGRLSGFPTPLGFPLLVFDNLQAADTFIGDVS